MKLSITIQTPEVSLDVPVALISGSLAEKIAKAASWGADGVELMTINPRELDWHQILSQLKDNNIEAAAVASGAMAFAAGITLLNGNREVMALAKTRLYDLVDFAAALGAPVVTIGSFRGRIASVASGDAGGSSGDGCQMLRDILAEAGEYSATRSVKLAIEAANRYELDFIHNHAQAMEFINSINQPALGILLDTFHMNIEEDSWDSPFERTIRAGKLYHVHLGDNNRLPTGCGMIDFARIVATLRRLGYSGYLSAELLARPDPDTAAKQTIAYMLPLLKN
jgi:sugar phosphate isomerase/epimerase